MTLVSHALQQTVWELNAWTAQPQPLPDPAHAQTTVELIIGFVNKEGMKSTITILMFAAISTFAQGQDYDSLKQKILKMDMAINTMHQNMQQSHKQFRTGTMLIITGTALSVVGALLMKPEPGDLANNNANPTIIYVGAGIMTIGTIIQIDSHKWIGSGGRRRR